MGGGSPSAAGSPAAFHRDDGERHRRIPAGRGACPRPRLRSFVWPCRLPPRTAAGQRARTPRPRPSGRACPPPPWTSRAGGRGFRGSCGRASLIRSRRRRRSVAATAPAAWRQAVQQPGGRHGETADRRISRSLKPSSARRAAISALKPYRGRRLIDDQQTPQSADRTQDRGGVERGHRAGSTTSTEMPSRASLAHGETSSCHPRRATIWQ